MNIENEDGNHKCMCPVMKGINLIGKDLEKICDVWKRFGENSEMICELEVNPFELTI